MKFFIYISLLIISLSKINIVEYGKEIPFDINNNEFQLAFNEEGALLISITFDTPDILNLNLFFKDTEYKYQIDPPGFGTLMPYKPDYTNRIILEYLSPSNAEGTIKFLPTTEEIPIKLNQTYQWKYNIISYLFEQTTYQLVYSINKSEKDAILKFKYDNNFKVENKTIAPNPSKICHGDICENSITTYNITKGESYKIYITINFTNETESFGPSPILNAYYLPSFSFNFIGEKEYQEGETKQEGESKQEEEKKKEEEIKKEEETKQEEKKEEGQKIKKEEEKEKSNEQSQKKENSKIHSNKDNTIIIILNLISLVVFLIFVLLCCKKGKSNTQNYSNQIRKFELKEVS